MNNGPDNTSFPRPKSEKKRIAEIRKSIWETIFPRLSCTGDGHQTAAAIYIPFPLYPYAKSLVASEKEEEEGKFKTWRGGKGLRKRSPCDPRGFLWREG